MSLLGPEFITTVALLAASSFAATLWLWPRFGQPGLRALAGRAALLLTVNVLVVATAAVGLNDLFGFFAGWTDLLGAAAPPAVVTVTGSAAAGGPVVGVTVPAAATVSAATVSAAATVPVLPSAAASAVVSAPARAGGAAAVPPREAGEARSLPVPVGGPLGPSRLWGTFSVTGAGSAIRADIVVQLPAAYFDPAQAHRRFPVIEAFHGYPGRPQQWVQGMALGSALRDEAVAHRLPEAIIVAPDVQVPPGADSECVDPGGAAGSPPGTRVETWADLDVPAWVSATFRTRPDRESWATIGMSSGGWCAASAAMLHPDRFGSAIVLGGYFRPSFVGRAPFAAGSPAARRYDLVRLAGTAPPAVNVWLETSRADAVSYGTSAAFLAGARPPLAVQAVVLADAGHRFGVWQALLPRALEWLGRTAAGFHPVLTA